MLIRFPQIQKKMKKKTKRVHNPPPRKLAKVTNKNTEKYLKHVLFFLAAPHGFWDLSSPMRDQTQPLGSESMES